MQYIFVNYPTLFGTLWGKLWYVKVCEREDNSHRRRRLDFYSFPSLSLFHSQLLLSLSVAHTQIDSAKCASWIPRRGGKVEEFSNFRDEKAADTRVKKVATTLSLSVSIMWKDSSAKRDGEGNTGDGKRFVSHDNCRYIKSDNEIYIISQKGKGNLLTQIWWFQKLHTRLFFGANYKNIFLERFLLSNSNSSNSKVLYFVKCGIYTFLKYVMDPWSLHIKITWEKFMHVVKHLIQ